MSKILKRSIAILLIPVLFAGCDKLVPTYVFDLTRLAADSSAYKGNNRFTEQPWACVLDNKTGLTWEVKTATPGLHAGTNTYTWYSRDENTNGGVEGKRNGGVCTGSDCDTESFIAAVNAERLCGYADWHLPSKDELRTLVDVTVRMPGPTLPVDYFPNTQNSKFGYWSATVFRMHKGSAWGWRFDQAADFAAVKEEPRHVKLVHGTYKPAEDQKAVP